MIPPNLTPEPGFPDSIARVAAIKKAVIASKPPRAVFLSSIGSEKPSGLGLITTTRILEQQLGSTGVPGAFLRAGSFMENILHSIPAAWRGRPVNTLPSTSPWNSPIHSSLPKI